MILNTIKLTSIEERERERKKKRKNEKEILLEIYWKYKIKKNKK
jgi:hypothetical protein